MSFKNNIETDKDTEIIAVFIDGDNISYKNIPVILQEIRNYGKIIINNVYCDWSSLEYNNLRQTSIENGITTIQCDKVTGKNSTDIKLMVDLMKTLYEINHVSLYYIVTSDSDYRHVIPQIKMKNKKVHCIGSVNSNKSIQSICDLFTKIEVLVEYNNRIIKNQSNDTIQLLRDSNQEIKNSKSKQRSLSKDNNSFKSNLKKIDMKIIFEIHNVVENNKKLNLGALKTLLQRKYTFDYREYGYNSMKSFIEKNSEKFGCVVIGNEYITKKMSKNKFPKKKI